MKIIGYTPTHRAYCKRKELIDLGSGKYQIADAAVASVLGYGSEIYVIDDPGVVLLWDSKEQVAYDWTTPRQEAGA